ncbi:ATP-dependent Lon protease [Hypnocyclicus thermotrophus]|uniref:endopeptidase La n=1 Tax=Hypnocyclicus thermotrophus TaxID=1627895 RepID=A0AA46DZ87_9FUSO|nr:Lon family ATP-dependent protease [Hypnocyclicus thermotrophus]TDT71485.1 ATP-dependent Lon protease [Hypnocyclicus thermotrophus]
MDKLLDKIRGIKDITFFKDASKAKKSEKKIDVLYGLLANVYGAKNMVEIAKTKGVLEELKSLDVKERAYALLVITANNNTHTDIIVTEKELDKALEVLEERAAEIISLKSIEKEITLKVNKLMEEKHKEYLREMKKKIISEEIGPESEFSKNKLKEIEELESKKKLKTVMETLRPQKLSEIVGQEKAIQALLTKLATPYPQHVILYGPPGVGKTTAARLILEEIKKLDYTNFEKDAPFVEVDGTTLRWDPRDVSNPLIGSVHDPIYQGAQKDFASDGIPEPKIGLVTKAHGGVLFIDEIGEIDIKYQSKLLKVLEDKRVNFESAYYDPENPKIPKYIKRLFEKGAPADFILIGATTSEPKDINIALRSRVAEIYFEPLNSIHIKKIVQNACEKLNVEIEEDALDLISNYTIEGRKAVNILADVYSSLLYKNYKNKKSDKFIIKMNDVEKIIKINRLNRFSRNKGKDKKEIGRVFGLGVYRYLGSLIEFEAAIFENKEGKGRVRFNETAGSMTKDSIFNALTVAKNYTKLDTEKYDIHINIIGGGKVDGPSAGAAITTLIISVLKNLPMRQDVAITGEISLIGDIKPVGGIVEKIYGAKQFGMKKVLVPYENKNDVPEHIEDIEIKLVKTIDDVIKELS